MFIDDFHMKYISALFSHIWYICIKQKILNYEKIFVFNFFLLFYY